MSANGATREQLLERYGRFYGDQHFAVAFTATIQGDEAKRVTTQGWDKTAPLPDADYAAGLIANRGKTRNPAIVLRPSNLVVLECDTEDDLVRIDQLGLPATVTVRSSADYKRHFYYRPPPGLDTLPYVAFRFESGKLTADVGRYFLAPPSVHPSGQVYAFLPGRGPDDLEIAVIPEPVYRQLAEDARVEDDAQREHIRVDPDAKIHAGNRRDMLFRYACMLRRWGLSRPEITQAVYAYNDRRCEPPVERNLVDIQIDGAIKKDGDQELAYAIAHPAPDDVSPPVPQHSWTPIDLVGAALAPPEPPTIGSIVYPGRRHVFSGEPETLKSWAVLVLTLEEIQQAHPVIYIDLEMGRRDIYERLQQLGATDDQLRGYLLYLEPAEAITAEGVLPDVRTLVRTRRPTLVIIDAFTGALELHGYDPNSGKDVERFYRIVVSELRAHGAAVVILDHLTKDKEARGKFAIGSERKIGAADVHLRFDIIQPFGRGKTGKAKLEVKKDRPGHLPRPRAAQIELSSSSANGHITYTLSHTETSEQPRAEWRPTALMEKVSRYVENCVDSPSRSAITAGVIGKTDFIRRSIDYLIQDGYLTEEDGPRGARIVLLVKKYREAESATPPHIPDPAPTPPRAGSSDPAPPRPPPTGGRGPAEDEVGTENDATPPPDDDTYLDDLFTSLTTEEST